MIARRSPMFCQSCREVSASPSYVGGLTVAVLDRINHSHNPCRRGDVHQVGNIGAEKLQC